VQMIVPNLWFDARGRGGYLHRLAIVAAGGDPGPDPFLEALESMARD
jgi:hypothetical protein